MQNGKLFLLFVVAMGCSKSGDSDTIQNVKPFQDKQLLAASEYSRSHGGSGVLVLQNGSVIYENYHNGADESTPTPLHSGTKSFFAATTAVALQEGIFDSYGENISETITEWQDSLKHPEKDKITLKHLVSLTSGLSQDFRIIGGANPKVPDIYHYAVNDLKLHHEPGTYFQYGPSNFYVYGEFLKRKLLRAGLEQDPLEYLESRIFDKIGFTHSKWLYDEAGNPHIPNGCSTNPRNWVKFGQLLLQKGKWNGEEILDGDYVNDLFGPMGTNSGYGVFLWLNKPGGFSPSFAERAPKDSSAGIIFYDGYPDIVACLGAGKNRMYIIPSLNAVIVRQTLANSDGFLDNEFLELILPE